MGWRQSNGIEEITAPIPEPSPPEKEEQDTCQILKLKKCLHGEPCPFIYVNDYRQTCKKNQEPIFEMDSCPMNKWFKYGEKI